MNRGLRGEVLAIGGRHGLTWYDASTDTRIRLRVHEHQLELSGRPLASNPLVPLRDRLAIGITTHRVASQTTERSRFYPGTNFASTPKRTAYDTCERGES